jgi:hypothetical protein
VPLKGHGPAYVKGLHQNWTFVSSPNRAHTMPAVNLFVNGWIIRRMEE